MNSQNELRRVWLRTTDGKVFTIFSRNDIQDITDEYNEGTADGRKIETVSDIELVPRLLNIPNYELPE